MSWKVGTLVLLASAQILGELFLLALSKVGEMVDHEWQAEFDD